MTIVGWLWLLIMELTTGKYTQAKTVYLKHDIWDIYYIYIIAYNLYYV
jgi:hypothetical protein